MKRRSIALAVGALVTILLFQNCGPSLQMAAESESVGLSSTVDPTVDPVPPGTLGNLAQNPYKCVADSDPGVNVMRRLTLREYTNTLNDLMAGQVTTAELQQELGSIPKETVLDVPATRLFDTSNPKSMNLSLLQAYHRTASKVADLAVASTVKINAVAGDVCMSAVTVSDACVNGFLDRFGLRAYRRPLTAAEKTKFLVLYRSGASSPERMARVIHALLLSPQFLYQITDNGNPVAARTDLLQFSPYEMASRISYMVLGSMPDAELFNAAANGSLSTAAGLTAQVDRLFALPRARSMVQEFYSQWLRLDLLNNKNVTPAFADGINTAQLQVEARQEVIDFMDHAIWTQGANYQALLNSNLVFPKGPNLARIYGVAQSQQPVQVSDRNRKGLLTRVGILSQSSGEETSPIKRGIKMRVNLLCDSISAPASALLQQAVQADPLTSTRTQVTTKTSGASCIGCHSQFNPLGFALENYDAFGRYRVGETVSSNGQSAYWQIDAKVIPNILGFDDAAIDGAAEMQERMALSHKGPACFARQYFQFSLGRAMESADACSLSPMYEAISKSGGSMQEMFKTLIKTSSFQQKKLN